MRNRIITGGLRALLLVGLSICVTHIARAQTQTPPVIVPAHQRIISYAGPETCLACHQEAGKQVAESLHYQLGGYAVPAKTAGEGNSSGMLDAYWLPGATAASINWIGLLQPQDASKPPQPGGCAVCHTTLGPKPHPMETLTETDFKNIDCLMCHGPGYSRRVVQTGESEGVPVFGFAPVGDVDIIQVAQGAGAPTDEMCLRCHAGVGGDTNAGHGDVRSEKADVHTTAGLQCTDCHTTLEHEMVGGLVNNARDDLAGDQAACDNCHPGHSQSTRTVDGMNLSVNEALDQHSEYIACQTCHIPFIARDPDIPTVTYRDFALPALDEESGLYAPRDEWEGNLRPEYAWWNGAMHSPDQPGGSFDDGVIAPWKRATYNVPVDASRDTPLPIHTGVYAVSGELDAAVVKGVEEWRAIHPEFQYSGEYEMVEESMLLALNHQVASASEAIGCTACHTNTGARIDFIDLGYDPKQAALLSSFPPLAPTPQPTATLQIATGTPEAAQVTTETTEPTTTPTEPTVQPQTAPLETDGIRYVSLFMGMVLLTALAIYANTGDRAAEVTSPPEDE